MIIVNIIAFIFVLGIIVLIHEMGHFIFAKRAGILCHEFSIGMGPALYKKKKGETIYAIRAIPIGGYVSMAGESTEDSLIKEGMQVGLILDDRNEVTEIVLDLSRETQVFGEVKSLDLYGKEMAPLFIELDNGIKYSVKRNAKYYFKKDKELQITPAESSFETKTLWQRFLTIFAGPAMNFVLAFILYLLVALISGKPQNTNVIGKTNNNEIRKSDQIIQINEKTISNWTDISNVLGTITTNEVTYTILREEKEIVVTQKLKVALQTFGIVVNTNDEGLVFITQTFGRAGKSKISENDILTKVKLGDEIFTEITVEKLIELANTSSGSKTIQLTVLRGNEEIVSNEYKALNADDIKKLGELPVATSLNINPEYKFDLGYSLIKPFKNIGSDVGEMFSTIGLLFTPQSSVKVSDLSGPLGIFNLVSNITSQGILALISFTAFLSINIGLINLLPIPALDGGRLVFLGIEAVTRKKMNRKVEYTIINVVFVLLLILFVFVTFNDILRLI
ncbi:Membrane-associated metallopeptidase, M50 family [Alteracholeplasma palmae J233]|uniref:Membrane-associated metallopeptidase, M50 family n=1 Tax=Alteracholeplasma palmae (strain ATCC 49389 / J233) TaxID=1318466 RepID=U4KR44_ALTPJ|nr:RIP metalloprotease RseP [Alteracholeplasma palmae]CCV63856.1 Membrane-associated metallopeptidase, M50 family [Alteracholeplasma palmae J233]